MRTKQKQNPDSENVETSRKLYQGVKRGREKSGKSTKLIWYLFFSLEFTIGQELIKTAPPFVLERSKIFSPELVYVTLCSCIDSASFLRHYCNSGLLSTQTRITFHEIQKFQVFLLLPPLFILNRTACLHRKLIFVQNHCLVCL